ncbi:MAG: hypothetical protein E7319_00890 [Clostridiales bacterium]|nr:hypothetical protein [Clostridiales bacterium]
MQQPPKVKQKKAPSMWLALVILAVAALAALALVLLLPQLVPPAEQLYPDPEVVLTFQTLDISDAAQLDSITIQHAAGDSYTLRYKDGALYLEENGQLLDINDSYSEEFIAAATTIAVENTVAEDAAQVEEHLAEMGLAPAQTTVRVRYVDGKTNVLEIGAGVPLTTYSYYRWSGDPGVYMCDVGIAEIFALEANRLMPVEQPVLDAGLADRVEIRNTFGDLTMQFTVNEQGISTATLVQPVCYPMSSSATSAMITVLDSLRLGTLLGDLTEENRAQYGFDQPLCTVDIHQQEGFHAQVNGDGQLIAQMMPAQQFRFVFGCLEEEFFYTCAYEGKVYLVSRFLVEPWIAAKADSLLTARPADMGTAQISDIQVETQTGSLHVQIDYVERVMENNELELDAEGNEIYDLVAVCNGESIPADQAQALVDRITAMGVSGSVPTGWKPETENPRWRIVLTTIGGTSRTLEAYRLDAFSDALAVDGVIMHYCYVEALASAMGEMMP